MLGIHGCIQREGEVVNLVAHDLVNLSAELASVGDRDGAFPLPHGRGDEFHHGSPRIDPRELRSGGAKARDIYVADLPIETIRIKSRDFK
jgi:error-prone DNA polymerase